MTGASYGGGSRYYIGGRSGEALVGAGVFLDSVYFALEGMRRDMERGQRLLARQQAGEVLDEVDQEHLEKFLQDLRERETNAQAKIEERMQRRIAALRSKAEKAAKAAQLKIDEGARAEYRAKIAATGFNRAHWQNFWIQFRLIGIGIALGMLGASLLGN